MAFMTGLTGGKSNADKRRTITLTDQHGRVWHGEEDKDTGAVCGRYEPKGWTAPFFVPQGGELPYYERPEGRPYDLVIHYDRYLAHLKQAHAEWKQMVLRVGIKLHGQKFDGEPTIAVLDEVGPGPQPMEPVIAMKQGNKFALGLVDTVDERLRPFLPSAPLEDVLDFSDADFADAAPGIETPERPTGRVRMRRAPSEA